MALLDLNHLKRIVGDEPAFLRQVLQIFIRNAPVDMQSWPKPALRETTSRLPSSPTS